MGIANPSPASSIQYDRERTSRSRSLYEWAARRGVDLDDITSGYGLTLIETHLLFENLRYFREASKIANVSVINQTLAAYLHNPSTFGHDFKEVPITPNPEVWWCIPNERF